MAIGLLAFFAFNEARTAEAASMKAMISVYMATSLCIGANMFSIKTAALAWFLYGATNAVRDWEMPGASLPFEAARDIARPFFGGGLRSNAREW